MSTKKQDKRNTKTIDLAEQMILELDTGDYPVTTGRRLCLGMDDEPYTGVYYNFMVVGDRNELVISSNSGWPSGYHFQAIAQKWRYGSLRNRAQVLATEPFVLHNSFDCFDEVLTFLDKGRWPTLVHGYQTKLYNHRRGGGDKYLALSTPFAFIHLYEKRHGAS